MAGWHHRCKGHELGQTSGGGEGQGGLAYCRPGDCNESDTTGGLNNNLGKAEMELTSGSARFRGSNDVRLSTLGIVHFFSDSRLLSCGKSSDHRQLKTDIVYL